jgi:hypothetical protein
VTSRELRLTLFGALLAAAVLMLSGSYRHVDPPSPVAPDLPSLLVPTETSKVFMPCLPVENLLKINGCPMVVL